MTIITLMGIDGTGKSTQCELLVKYLREQEIKCRLFYAGNSGLIIGKVGEQFSIYLSLPIDVLLKRLCRVSTDPIPRRYWMMRSLNSALLFLNYLLLVLPRILVYEKFYSVVVMDRYVYDYIINTIAHGTYSKILSNLLLRFAPRPDLEILLDINCETAFERKRGEKNLQELGTLRKLYLRFAQTRGLSIVNTSNTVADTFTQILRVLNTLSDI